MPRSRDPRGRLAGLNLEDHGSVQISSPIVLELQTHHTHHTVQRGCSKSFAFLLDCRECLNHSRMGLLLTGLNDSIMLVDSTSEAPTEARWT